METASVDPAEPSPLFKPDPEPEPVEEEDEEVPMFGVVEEDDDPVVVTPPLGVGGVLVRVLRNVLPRLRLQ